MSKFTQVGRGSPRSAMFRERSDLLSIRPAQQNHNDINPDPLLAMKESMKTHEHQFSNDKPNFTIQLKPAVQSEAFKSATATTYIPKWKQQLSTADGTIPHFGLKAYAIGFKNAYLDPGIIEVTYKMYFTMKNNE